MQHFAFISFSPVFFREGQDLDCTTVCWAEDSSSLPMPVCSALPPHFHTIFPSPTQAVYFSASIQVLQIWGDLGPGHCTAEDATEPLHYCSGLQCDGKAESLEGTSVLSETGLYWQSEEQLCPYLQCWRHWCLSPPSFYSKSSSSPGDLVQLTFHHLPHTIMTHVYVQSSPVRSSVGRVSSHLLKHLFWDTLAGAWPLCDLTQVLLLQLSLQRSVF